MAERTAAELHAYLKRAAELEGMLFSCQQARHDLERRLREDISDEAREKGQYQIGDTVPFKHETPGDKRRENEAIEAIVRNGGVVPSVRYVGYPVSRPNNSMPSNYKWTRGMKKHADESVGTSVVTSVILGVIPALIVAVLLMIFTDLRFKTSFCGAAVVLIGALFVYARINKEWKPSEADIKAADEYDQFLNERNAILAKELVLQERVNADLQVVKPMEAQLCEALQQHYAADIVHEKYRGFTTITQIYEYFDTGRCDELTGPNGAYNLYEAELRANVIISQLGQILSRLEQIKQNQYMIYRVIQETNSLLGGIEQELRSLEGAVNANTAVIADFNASVTARL